MSDNWLLLLYCKWRCKRGPRYARLWNSEQTILSKSWVNLIYLESVNDSSRNFSSLVSSGCKNVSSSSFANSFSSSDGMCHWIFRLKRSPGFPQSYTWRTEIQIYIITTIKKSRYRTWLDSVCTWLLQRHQHCNCKMIGRLISAIRDS